MASGRLAAPGIALSCACLEAGAALLLAMAPWGQALWPWWWALAALALVLLSAGASLRRRALLLLFLPLLALTLGAAIAAPSHGALAGLALSYGAALLVGESGAVLAQLGRAREAWVSGVSLALGAGAAALVAWFAEGLGLEATALGCGLGAALAALRLGGARFGDALDAERGDVLGAALARLCAAPRGLLLAALGRNEG